MSPVGLAIDWLKMAVQNDLHTTEIETILNKIVPAALSEYDRLVEFRRRVEKIIDVAEDDDYWNGLPREDLVILEQLQELVKEDGKT